MSYLIGQFRHSKTIKTFYMSTDSEEYIRVGRKYYPSLIGIKRPANLAEDVPMERVMAHALQHIHPKPGVLACLQVTTPFTTAKDIDGCVNALVENPLVNSAITFCVAGEKPEWMFKTSKHGGNMIVKSLTGKTKGKWGRRQSLGEYIRPNGGVYAVRTRAFEVQHTLYAIPILPVMVPRERSFDVDEPFDLRLLRAYVNSESKGLI